MGKINKDNRAFIYERDDHKCLKCGINANLTIDHVIPLSVGGLNHVSNYQTLCRGCNISKSDRIIDYRWYDGPEIEESGMRTWQSVRPKKIEAAKGIHYLKTKKIPIAKKRKQMPIKIESKPQSSADFPQWLRDKIIVKPTEISDKYTGKKVTYNYSELHRAEITQSH